jgi:hypothetical protein
MSQDAAHWWGQDLQIDSHGDLATVGFANRDNQRIFRRLCTNGSKSGAQIGEYFFHPEYGGSAPWYVGQTSQELLLEGVIRSQMYMETSVAHNPEPDITITFLPTGQYISNIIYTNSETGQPVPELVMDVSNN